MQMRFLVNKNHRCPSCHRSPAFLHRRCLAKDRAWLACDQPLAASCAFPRCGRSRKHDIQTGGWRFPSRPWHLPSSAPASRADATPRWRHAAGRSCPPRTAVAQPGRAFLLDFVSRFLCRILSSFFISSCIAFSFTPLHRLAAASSSAQLRPPRHLDRASSSAKLLSC